MNIFDIFEFDDKLQIMDVGAAIINETPIYKKIIDIGLAQLTAFEGDERQIEKILEEQIIKMSYKSFCQVVILGSSNYIPFMKLPAKDRRLVVENLLDKLLGEDDD